VPWRINLLGSSQIQAGAVHSAQMNKAMGWNRPPPGGQPRCGPGGLIAAYEPNSARSENRPKRSGTSIVPSILELVPADTRQRRKGGSGHWHVARPAGRTVRSPAQGRFARISESAPSVNVTVPSS
jgi:hypothetical protein